MTLKEIMTPGVQVIRPDLTLKGVADKMKELDVGMLPVCDGDRIVGMITDRDIVVRALAADKDPERAKVSDIMTKDVHFIFDDQDVKEAAQLMKDRQVRRLIVVDRNKKLVGVVSLSDIAAQGERQAKVA